MQATSECLEYIVPHEEKRKSDCIHYKNKICYNSKRKTYNEAKI